jgi:hypothetical protein
MYELMLHKYQIHRKEWYYPMQLGKQHKRGDFIIYLRYSKQTHDGTSIHHVNRCVEEHSETPFDYWSLMYIINKHEKTHR